MTVAQCGRALSGELAPSGDAEDRLDQQADTTVADAGDLDVFDAEGELVDDSAQR